MNQTKDMYSLIKVRLLLMSVLFFGIFIGGCKTSEDETGLPDGIEDIGNAFQVDTNIQRFNVLRNNGGYVNVEELDFMVVNIDGRIVLSYVNECPYDQCRTEWLYLDNRFHCTCCDSVFENSGRVNSGPATENLISLSTSKDGDFITVFKREQEE